jgi:ATP-dependent Clp protease protease subunit
LVKTGTTQEVNRMSQQKNKKIRVFDEDHFDFLAPPQKKLIGPSGEIWVTEFDESSAFNFREAMISKSKESPAPIIIYIDSYGGQVDALAKMIETMDEIDNIKITVCMGKAMSAGAILLSHGDVRYCGQHSRIMIHESLGSVGGRMSDINANTEEMNRINNYFIGMLANNCGIRGGSNALKTMIKERGNSDWYMDAKQALEFKIIDFVGIPVLRQNFESGLVPIVKKNTIRKKIFHEVPPSDFLQEVLPKKPKKPKSKSKK